MKLSGSGVPIWSTYLGGSDNDVGWGIAADSIGNVFVTGSTSSSGWVSGGFDTTYGGGLYDAFVVKLSGSGAHLWSTYLGGSDEDDGTDIALDGVGNVFVTGRIKSSGWVSEGFDTTPNGNYDPFVAELSGSGSHLWSTYMGGSDNDISSGIGTDGRGNIFVTGYTSSSFWILGKFDATFNGGVTDGFVAKIQQPTPARVPSWVWQLY